MMYVLTKDIIWLLIVPAGIFGNRESHLITPMDHVHHFATSRSPQEFIFASVIFCCYISSFFMYLPIIILCILIFNSCVYVRFYQYNAVSYLLSI